MEGDNNASDGESLPRLAAVIPGTADQRSQPQSRLSGQNNEIAGRNSNTARSPVDTTRMPSPFLQSMVQIADRVTSSAPLLDLTVNIPEGPSSSGLSRDTWARGFNSTSWMGNGESQVGEINHNDAELGVGGGRRTPALTSPSSVHDTSTLRGGPMNRQDIQGGVEPDQRLPNNPLWSFLRSSSDRENTQRNSARSLPYSDNSASRRVLSPLHLNINNSQSTGRSGQRIDSAAPDEATYTRDEVNSLGVPSNIEQTDREHNLEQVREYLDARRARYQQQDEESHAIIERSAAARRDLEQALRDYRHARNALRADSVNISNNSDATRIGDSRSEDLSQRWMESVTRVRENRRILHLSQVMGLATSNRTSASTNTDQGRQTNVTSNTSNQVNTTARREEVPNTPVPTVAALRAARIARQPPIEITLSEDEDISPAPGWRRTRSSHRDTTQDVNVSTTNNSDQSSSQPLLAEARNHSGTSTNQHTGISGDTINTRRQLRYHNHSLPNAIHLRRPVKLPDTKARNKAKSHLRYLTQLKSCGDDGVQSMLVASKLGLDPMYDSLVSGKVADLPMRVDELPLPSECSWLEAGVRWSGEQSGGHSISASSNGEGSTFTSGILFDRRIDAMDRMLSLRTRIHQEEGRVERREQNLQLARTGIRTPMGRNLLRGSNAIALAGTVDALADMERHLSDLLEDQEQRTEDNWGWPADGRHGIQHHRISSDGRQMVIEGKWPVKVVLHSVDWNKMTVCGSMSASQIPDRSRSQLDSSSTTPEENAGSTSMESFFDGEIIDLRRNELETVAGKDGYRIGGLLTDLQYWAGIGPFKEEVQLELIKKKIRKQMQQSERTTNDDGGVDQNPSVLDPTKVTDKDGLNSVDALGQAPATDVELDDDEKEEAMYEAMSRCLGSQKWLNESLGANWILMRWKERFFVAPSASSGVSSSSGGGSGNNNIRPRITRIASSDTYSPHDNASWGLTISGFYYVALHRQTGKIEGLYYDVGSAPYQRLQMIPDDCIRAAGGVVGLGGEDGDRGVNGGGGSLGIRTCFPAVGLR